MKKNVIIAIVIMIVIIITVFGIAGNKQEVSTSSDSNQILSQTKINSFGIFINDNFEEKYNENGDLIYYKYIDDTDNIENKFEYEYTNGKVAKLVSKYVDNQFDSNCEINISYDKNENISTLTIDNNREFLMDMPSNSTSKTTFNYIYNNERLIKIEKTKTNEKGTTKTNYYYTTQNINGIDYIVEQAVDDETSKVTNIRVAKEIEYNMSSKFIGNYIIPFVYLQKSAGFVDAINWQKNGNSALAFGTITSENPPVIMKDLVYTQGKTFAESHVYYNENSQIVLDSSEGIRTTSYYEKIDNNCFYQYEITRDEYTSIEDNFQYRKLKLTYENGICIKGEVIEKENISEYEYNSRISEFEANALKEAVTYKAKLKNYND